ncbi:PAAR-like domain-containing protein [Sorangium sp. So ce281]|uniref:PAAR-like domain-containing protein n=1 Tax=unclassified Sorangium TaxID=2621164 RepID=UPI003F627363
MSKVTALGMDTITEKSGHQMTGMAVSVCTTPAAPSPVPIPYPTAGTVSEGIIDAPMRTKITGAKILTVGGCMKACHGNEPGTLKEVVSFNTGGPCFPWLGAPNVLIELGMAGITGSMGQMNKSITVGASGSASGAGGGGDGGGGGGAGAGAPGAGGPQGPSNGGGGGGGSNQGAGPPSPPAAPAGEGQAGAGHPVDVITGTLYTPPRTDFLLPGFLPVAWTRFYRTSSVRDRVGLGHGWSHALAWRAELRDGVLTLIDETLRRTAMREPDAGTELLLPFGRRLWWQSGALVVDLDDGLLRVLRPAGEAGQYRLAALRDRFGNAAEIRWDDGEVVGIVDSVGRHAWLDRQGPYKVWWVEITGEDGAVHRRRLVTYELDEAGDLVRVIDAGGAEVCYAYDDEHYLVRERQPDGLTFHFRYADVLGQRRCVETWADLEGGDVLVAIGAPEAFAAERPRGLYAMRLSYGPGPFETAVQDGLGARFRYRGNALGLVERYEDPRGGWKQLVYSTLGQVVRSVTPDGGERRAYDAAGRLVGFEDAEGRSFSLRRRDGDGAITEVRDPAGERYALVPGPHGEVIERIDPLGARTSYAYDARGQVTAITGPDGSAERFVYDARGNLAERTWPSGATFRYTHDLLGQLVRVETPRGAVYELEYDSRGLPVRVNGPGGVVVEHGYDDAGRRVATRHPGGGLTRLRYAGGLLVEEIKADGSRFRYGYDALARLAWIENPAGERLSMERDACGNVARSKTFSGVLTEYEHDVRGRVVRAEVPGAVVRRFVYDRTGAPVHREDGDVVTTFAYDPRGLVRRATRGATDVLLERNALGRVVREEQRLGGFRFVVERAFNAKGHTVGRRYSTGWEIKLDREHGSGVASMTIESAAGVERVRIEEDGLGRETARVREGGYAIRTTRDDSGRPVVITVEDAAGRPLRERRYAWSAGGPVTEVEDSAHGRRRYALDVYGRPLAVAGLGVEEQFTYDVTGTPVTGSGVVVGPAGRVQRTETAAFTWDVLGRLSGRAAPDRRGIWAYTYDDLDQLARAERGDGFVVQYHYDAFARRLGELRSDGTSIWYGWDENAPVEEIGSDGRSVRRVFADDEHTPLAEAEAGGAFRGVVTDAASTPWLMVDPTGALASLDLGALGAEGRAEGRFTGLRFAGQRQDELTGLCYQRARWYAPELGTFTTADPLGPDASAFEVAFVPNVTAWIDPLGLVILLMSDDWQCRHGAQSRAAKTGQRIVHWSELGRTPNVLAGEPHVDLYGHGNPGQLAYAHGNAWQYNNEEKQWQWAPNFTGHGWSGRDLGQLIHGAGFRGSTIHMTVCHGGTEPPGQPGGSIAQQIASATGATTIGCVGDKMYDHPTLPGVTIAGKLGRMTPFEPSS